MGNTSNITKENKAPSRENTIVDGFTTIAGAMDFLKLSRASVYKLMDCGELAYARFGRCRRIPLAALRAYAEKALVGE